jgi:hypothetical protein
MALVASPAGNGRPRCPRHARTRPRVAKYSIRIAWHHGASGFLAPERPRPVAHLAGREDPDLAVPLITPCNQPSCGSREISAVRRGYDTRSDRRLSSTERSFCRCARRPVRLLRHGWQVKNSPGVGGRLLEAAGQTGIDCGAVAGSVDARGKGTDRPGRGGPVRWRWAAAWVTSVPNRCWVSVGGGRGFHEGEGMHGSGASSAN